MKIRSALSFLVLLAATLFSSSSASAGTINGKIQTASGGAVANGTLTFSLNQVAYLPTAQVVAQQVPCYTDNFGNIVGEPDQTIAPSASVNLGSGTLAAGTYFVKTALQDASGVSNVSPEASFTLSAPGTLIVNAPGVQPANASGFRIYIGTASGNETLQGTVTGTPGSWANFSQSTALSAGSAMPVSNTTVCTFAFTDSLNPTTTYYTINLVNSLGSKIAGYPISQARFYGGTNGSVNVSSGWPVSIGGVIWPSPIVSTPNSNATQSIGGGLSLGTFPLAAGAATFTSEINPNVNGIRFANAFPGTGATQINNAENDLGSTNGLVWTPGTVACGAGQNLALKDNIFVFDFRTCSSAQQQGTNLLFNVKDTNNGAVRDKLMLVDPFTPANVMSAASSSASLYAHTFLEGNLATFATLEAFNGTITVDTGATNSPAVVVGIEGEASVAGTAANTLTDVRGGTFNVGVTGAGNITTASALRAQTVTNTGSGTVANAFSFVAEDQTVGTTSNLAIWSNGKAAFDKPVSFGSFAGGIVPQAAAMVFIRPQAGQLAGGTQTGLQSAPITSSGATSSGIGILSRADLGSAFTQGQNTGIEAQTPSLNGGTITRYTAFKADTPPVAGTVCLFEFGGATSGSTCLNATAVASGTAVLPAASGTVLVTGNGSTPVQTKRGTAGCATAASIGATCTITVTWTTAFADTNYTVTGCTGNATTSGVPLIQGITGKATGTVTVQTAAMTAVAAQFTNVECGAIHD